MEERTADATFVLYFEIWANAFLGIVITLNDRSCYSGCCKKKSWDSSSEMHFLVKKMK
jgi:hypothetical protein